MSIYCPGCRKNMDCEANYAELKEAEDVTEWCFSCARALYNPEDLKNAIRYAKTCRARETQPLLVMATHIALKEKDCPVCEVKLNLFSKPIPQLSICDGGHLCGVCGFFLPDLPSMIWREDGYHYGDRRRKHGPLAYKVTNGGKPCRQERKSRSV